MMSNLIRLAAVSLGLLTFAGTTLMATTSARANGIDCSSDCLIVYNPNGSINLQYSVGQSENGESTGIIWSTVPVDTSQWGTEIILNEPGVDPNLGYSDMVGLGVLSNGEYALFFTSDTESVNDSGDGRVLYVYLETGNPVDVTMFLDPTLRAQGYTATFQSDFETPLPGTLPLFATGLGALGLLGWRRKRKGAAAIDAA